MAFWAQMVLGFFASVLIAFAISRWAVVSANKQLSKEKISIIKQILNDANRSYVSKKADDAFQMYLYVFSGEQNPKDYREFVKLLKIFLSDKDPRRLRIFCIAGPHLMVENLKVKELKEIHPSMQLLTDPEFSQFIDFQMVDTERMPYHCLYCTHAHTGYAERPHKEVSEAIAWKFDNYSEYGKCFERWFELIKKSYNTHELKYTDGKLFLNEKAMDTHDRTEIKKLFFKVKGYTGHLNYFFKNSLKDEVRTYAEVTGMNMSNWNPYSERIFTENEIKLLTE